MSKTIDERVVSMQFDNAQFERNVSVSMSTLDKLKKALKFDNAGKSLENISKAAKSVDMSGLNTAVDTVKAKFSALDVVAVTALANITNSALNAGKNIVKSLTIDPVSTGFKEYELQMNSVQTILANTASKGTTMADVTSALDELNEYADLTIYNFAEMTKNIGTFTAAGVDLEKSVAAIKGIANLGAMSGSTSVQVSTAMYQLSQALAAGRVSLMDWNSVVNAGMGGEQFQNALKRTAEHFGSDVDGMIKKYGSFRESLTQGGWLTAEVLTETLNQIGGAYSKADLIQQGYTESQAEAITKMAETATDAATKVKTFTQLMDTMKEAAGSGWAKTWQVILGDFEEAKEFFTGLSDYFGEMIGNSADARNNVLQGAFDSNWVKLTREIENAGVPLDTFSKKVQEVAKANGVNVDAMIEKYGTFQKVMESGSISADIVTKSLKELAGSAPELNSSTEAMTAKLERFQKVVNEVWKGDHKNVDTGRIESLKKAGYEYAEVQALVNKTVDGHKLTLEDLNETQMKAIGFTDEQVKALQELAAQAEKTGTPINELINNLNKPSGRTLFLESIVNILKAIIEPLRAVNRAFGEVFAVDSSQIYGALEALHKFSQVLVAQPETLDKITRTFKGLFGILNIFTTFATGTFGVAFKVLTAVLDHFNLGILDVTAFIGDALYAFSEFITSGDIIIGVIEKIGSMFSWILDPLGDFSSKFSDIGHDIVEGLKKGLANGVTDIPKLLMDLGRRLVEAICSVLGINSPSTVMMEVGRNTIDGLLEGLKIGSEKVISFLKNLGSKIAEVLGKIDWGSVFSIAAIGAIIFVLNKFANGFNKLTAPLAGVGKVLGGVGNILDTTADVIADSTKKIKKVLNGFAKVLNANAFKTRTEGIRNMAISIAILAGSIYVLAQLDVGALWKAVGVIAALAAILLALSFAMNSMSSTAATISRDGIKLGRLSPSFVGIGLAILAMAGALKIIGGIDAKDAEQGLMGLINIMLLLASFVAVCGIVTKTTGFSQAGKIGSMMLGVSISMLLIVQAMKSLAKMDDSAINKGLAGIMKIVGVFAVMALITRLASSTGTPGFKGSILAMATSIVLLAGVAKLLSMMDQATINKGLKAIYAFVGVFAAMAIVTRLASSQKKRVGSSLLGMSVALLAMVGVVKLLGMMSPAEIKQGISAITKFVGLMAVMILITRIGKKDMASMASTLTAMSIAIGIMAAVAILIGLVPIENLIKGVAVVTILGLVLAAMITATRGATEVKGPLIAMTVAIGIMVGAVALLSLIDPKKLLGATVALSAMMLAFGGMIKLTSSLKSIKIGSFLPMVAMVAVLAGVVALISMLDANSALPNVIALSTLMLAFSASMKIINGTNIDWKAISGALVEMTLVTTALAAILWGMSALNVQNAIPNAVALSVLLLALSAALKIMSTVNGVSMNAMGAMAVLGLVMAELAGVLALMNYLNVDVSISQALSLGVLINALALACAIVSIIPLPGAIAGALGLAAFIGIVALVVAAAGALMKIPGAEEFAQGGARLLAIIGEAIGGFVGGIAKGFATEVLGILPALAQNLSLFAVGLTPFITSMKMMDTSVLANVITLAGAIALISAASFIDGVTRFLGLGDGIAGFATQASGLASGVMAFSDGTSGLNEDAATKAKIAADIVVALAEAASQIPNSGGWLGKIVGENDIGAFADQFSDVAVGINRFTSKLRNLDESAVDKVKMACEILTALAKAAQEIPNSGGWLGKIVGENDIDDFGSKLPALGEGLTSFVTSIAGLDESAGEKVKAAAEMIKSLATVAKEIPNTGGLLATFIGDNDLGTFGVDMAYLGAGLYSFVSSIQGMPDDVGTKVDTATSVIRKLAELVNSGILEGDDGFFTKIGQFFTGGEGETTVFGTQMANLGAAIGGFADEVKDLNVESVIAAVNAIRNIANIIDDIGEINADSVRTLSGSIPTLGSAISSYSTYVSSINIGGILISMMALQNVVGTMKSLSGIDSVAVDSAVTSIGKLGSAITNMSTINTSGVDAFILSLQKLAKVNISGVVSAFKSGEAQLSNVGVGLIKAVSTGMEKGRSATLTIARSIVDTIEKQMRSSNAEFTAIGNELIVRFISGISKGRSGVNTAIRTMLSSASSTLRSYYSSFYSAGSYVAKGFANGISANTYSAVAKAKAMASQAAKAARSALDINSPSKVFYQIGDFAGQGFVNALDDYGQLSYKAGGSMADYAKKGLTRAISKVGDLLENGIDSQPTIRPVLDLSDVESGAGALRGMFADSDLTIGASANIRAISAMMRQNGQNGPNDDVISALSKLRRDLGKIQANNYNINGITYDDGTNVAQAVQTLIRAARIERRA